MKFLAKTFKKLKKAIKKHHRGLLILEVLVCFSYSFVQIFPQYALAAQFKQTEDTLLSTISDYIVTEDSNLPISNNFREPHRVKNVLVTAYTSTPDQTDDTPFIAASGATVFDGMVANNCLPFGTRVRFPEFDSEKIYVITDRMNAKYGCNRADIWFPGERQNAINFGAKWLKMEIW